jgi:hypothetical protein
MDTAPAWLAAAGSLLALVGYELSLRRLERINPGASARSAHAQLRSAWVGALSRQAGSEMIAVQTLRNSLMSSTITASTAALAWMGALSLLVSSWARDPASATHHLSVRSLLIFVVLTTLLACHVCSAVAMRYFNHAGFVMSLPVDCAERCRRTAMADVYVRRAGLMYSWGLRCFLLLVPSLAGLVHPFIMPAAALGTIAALRAFDRVPE